MSKRARLGILMACCLLPAAGCGLLAPVIGPVHETTKNSVSQANEDGYIQFAGTGGEQRVFLDGKFVGVGTDFSSGKPLAVSAGSHLVEIRRGEALVLRETVFIGAGATREVGLR
jgi:hypothetical protein